MPPCSSCGARYRGSRGRVRRTNPAPSNSVSRVPAKRRIKPVFRKGRFVVNPKPEDLGENE